ncbi:MAG: hypothetical protein LBR20_03300 [Propionibacteriaceae bacterium]|nr:hypothetical protein [Propionibacteriaceae bacterium]
MSKVIAADGEPITGPWLITAQGIAQADWYGYMEDNAQGGAPLVPSVAELRRLWEEVFGEEDDIAQGQATEESVK